MSATFRCIGLLLALAVMAAPAAGLCVALAAPDDPCEMRESRHAAPCGHAPAVMTGCCGVELAGPDAEGVRPGAGGEASPPVLVLDPADTAAEPRAALAAASAGGDRPPAVPRYRLFSALLL